MATDAGTVTAIAVPSTTLEGKGDTGSITAFVADSGVDLPAEIFDSGTVTALAVFIQVFTKPTAVTNPDSKIAWPVTTITGPCDNPYLGNHSTGQVLRWNRLSLGIDDVLVVDHYRRTCYVNDVAVDGSYPVTTGWWGLIPGDNVIEAGAESGLTDGSVLVQFTRVWR